MGGRKRRDRLSGHPCHPQPAAPPRSPLCRYCPRILYDGGPDRGWVRAEKGLTRDYFHDFLFLPPAGADSKPTMLLATADKSPGYWRRESRGAKAAVFRSDDCAESWYRVGNGLPDDLDPMIWALTPHPHDSDSVFAGLGAVARGHASGPGDPGSILVSHDRGKNWQALPIELPADRVLYAGAD